MFPYDITVSVLLLIFEIIHQYYVNKHTGQLKFKVQHFSAFYFWYFTFTFASHDSPDFLHAAILKYLS